MRIRTICISIFCVSVVAPPALSQHMDELHLDRFLEEVQQENPGLQSIRQQWMAAAQVPSKVGSYDDPLFSFTRWLSTPETRVGPQTNVFMVSQKIPFPGKLSTAESIAAEDATIAGEAVSVSQRNLRYNATKLYYELYRIDASTEVLESYQEFLRDVLRVAETKYATGEGIQANVLKSQLEISTIEDRRLSLIAQRKGVVARMNALRNMSETTPIGRPSIPDVRPLILADSALVDMAVGSRQELSIARSMIRKHEFAMERQELEYYPNFSVQASYVMIPEGRTPALDAGKDPYSIGISMNIPIMFGRRSAAVEESRAKREASRFALEDNTNMVRAEVLDHTARIRESLESLELYEKGLLVQSQQVLASGIAAYQTGRMGYLDIIDAFRTVLKVQLTYIGERATLEIQIASLERVLGGRLPNE